MTPHRNSLLYDKIPFDEHEAICRPLLHGDSGMSLRAFFHGGQQCFLGLCATFIPGRKLTTALSSRQWRTHSWENVRLTKNRLHRACKCFATQEVATTWWKTIQISCVGSPPSVAAAKSAQPILNGSGATLDRKKQSTRKVDMKRKNCTQAREWAADMNSQR